MAEPQLGYWDYLKAAFHWKVALPLLGGMPLNKLVLAGFVILGIGNPGFWLLGVGYEAAYLLWLTGNPRFQRLVRGERLAASQQSWIDREREILLRLDQASQVRYRQLVDRCRAIMQSRATDDLGVIGLEELNQVRPAFLQLLSLRQRVRQMLEATRRGELETDIARLQDRLKKAPAGSPVARALEGTLKIQQARLENLARSELSLQYTETELERIEKQLSLIAEAVTLSRNPETWSKSVDGVMQTIQGTMRWMADNSELFESESASPAGPLIEGRGPTEGSESAKENE